MGYYTQYSLTITPDVPEVWEAVYSDDVMRFALKYGEPCKWYEHEEDMRELSRRFPDVLFKLSGHGEKKGDIWVKYFKNGKMQVCKVRIEFEPFDESKLA